jgi:hypothetical protein
VGFELTLAFVGILGFILAGTRLIVYNRIIKERDKILLKIEEDYKKLLRKPKIMSHEEKTNFIKDLSGLYRFETRLKTADRDFKDLFLGFIGLLIGVFIFDIFGLTSLIFVMIILEISGIWSFIAFSYINETNKYIDMYKFGKLPREFIKKMRIL